MSLLFFLPIVILKFATRITFSGFQNLHELMRSEPESDKSKRNFVFNDEYQLMLNPLHQQQREDDGQPHLSGETNVQMSRRQSRGTKRRIGDGSIEVANIDRQLNDQFETEMSMSEATGFQYVHN